jgi:CopG family nickel-responsive transcriptional regulator
LPGRIAICQRGFDLRPRHALREHDQRVAQIDHLIEAAAKKIVRGHVQNLDRIAAQTLRFCDRITAASGSSSHPRWPQIKHVLPRYSSPGRRFGDNESRSKLQDRTRMERFTISLDNALATQFDEHIAARGYGNRSEAIRDLIRSAIEADRQRGEPSTLCIANLSYLYNHNERELSERLADLQHDHHDLTVATMHCHLDHAHCIESVILKGPAADVRRFADALAAERGVHHGKLNLVSLEADPGLRQGEHSMHGHVHPAT